MRNCVGKCICIQERPPHPLAAEVDCSLATPLMGSATQSVGEVALVEASEAFLSDLLATSEEPTLPTQKSSSFSKRSLDQSSPRDPKKKKVYSADTDRRLGMPLQRSCTYSHYFYDIFTRPPLYSSTLARYATANPYQLTKRPELVPGEGLASEATLAMFHALRMNGLDMPTASYEIRDVSVSFLAL